MCRHSSEGLASELGSTCAQEGGGFQAFSESVKCRFSKCRFSALNLKFDFISDGGCTREKQIQKALGSLLPCGNRCRFSESAICSLRVRPPSEIKSNFRFKTLRWRPLRWRLTLSDFCHVYLSSVQQMVSGELAGECLQTGFERHGLAPHRAPLDMVYPLREHLNNVQRLVSGGCCEGLGRSAINLSNLGKFCQIWPRAIYLC